MSRRASGGDPAGIGTLLASEALRGGVGVGAYVWWSCLISSGHAVLKQRGGKKEEYMYGIGFSPLGGRGFEFLEPNWQPTETIFLDRGQTTTPREKGKANKC